MEIHLLILIAAVGVAIAAIWIGKSTLRQRRRAHLRELPFPAAWEEILCQRILFYRHLDDTLKNQLRNNIKIFLAEKNFEGCGGLVLTDEIRVTIAANACILLLNRKHHYYSGLSSILVYPSAYVVKESTSVNGIRFEGMSVRAGESWGHGTVVLAWDHARKGTMDIRDGFNVILHEFAHQLDQEDGSADGAPILDQRSSYVTWARVMSREYDLLLQKVARHKPDVLDEYGATNPAEFFAVSTEAFFEKPRQLMKKHPDLYDTLKGYYKLDPAEWMPDQPTA